MTEPSPRKALDLSLWLGVGGAAVAGLVVWSASSNAAEVWCLMRRAGMPCPGCGLTRGLRALLDGELGLAMSLHPLAPVVALEACVLWLAAGWQRWRRGAWPAPTGGQLERFLAVHAVTFVALWLGRTATGTVPW